MRRLAQNMVSKFNRRNKGRNCINRKPFDPDKLADLSDPAITFKKLMTLMRKFVIHRFSNCKHSGEWALERIQQQISKFQKKIDRKIMKSSEED